MKYVTAAPALIDNTQITMFTIFMLFCFKILAEHTRHPLFYQGLFKVLNGFYTPFFQTPPLPTIFVQKRVFLLTFTIYIYLL